ncbi:MAG: NAD-dependent deacetylase [Leptonema sp. (in: Bacteria)]|nr:NAD-dependent deacetylase [Leptonema sp. (in: bacteria)]
MASILETSVDKSKHIISEADSLIIAAGAGMGVDSGLPDFRGKDGFWQAYPALRKSNLDFYQMANPTTFEQRPDLAWGFYGHRLQMYRNINPHAGFKKLLNLGRQKPNGYFVFTSNVDGHFQKAGFNEENVYECHGSIHYLQCSNQCNRQIWPANSFLPEIDIDRCQLINQIPTCNQCNSTARPNILLFSDYGWLSNRSDSQQRRLENWLNQTSKPAIIEIGAGTAVPTVRRFSETIANHFNTKMIRINKESASLNATNVIHLQASTIDAIHLLTNCRH